MVADDELVGRGGGDRASLGGERGFQGREDGGCVGHCDGARNVICSLTTRKIWMVSWR